MVDVHIITRPTDNQKWLCQCIDSLEDEPVTVHLVDGVQGDTAAGRMKGFSQGNHPYVSFVDPDDYVRPGIFKKLVNVLERLPEAVMAYSDQVLVDEYSNEILPGWSADPSYFWAHGQPISLLCSQGQYIHHLNVMRRDAVTRCLPLTPKQGPEAVLFRKLARLGWLMHVPVVGYYWRQHANNTYKTYTDAEYRELATELEKIPKGAV